MIFVETRSYEHQLRFLSFLATTVGDLDLVCWFLPECNKPELGGFDLSSPTEEGVRPVTSYCDGESLGDTCTRRRLVTPALIEELRGLGSVVAGQCDSIALYPRRSPDWAACVIPHEGMALAASDGLLTDLRTGGFSATTDAPAWW